MSTGLAYQLGAGHEPCFLRCPDDMRAHCASVLRGEYDVPGLAFSTPPVVLDLGANCGAFAVWAAARWPGAKVLCYEPNPAAYDFLVQNTYAMKGVDAFRVAVTTLPAPLYLHLGRNNLGEASLYTWPGEQQDATVAVAGVQPGDLPPCDVLKVDTEGSERDILEAYAHRPRAIALEFHSQRCRVALDRMLLRRGYDLVRADIRRAARVLLCAGHERRGGEVRRVGGPLRRVPGARQL